MGTVSDAGQSTAETRRGCRADIGKDFQNKDTEARDIPNMALHSKQRGNEVKGDPKLSDAEVKELLVMAPKLVERAILRGWIQPPRYRLTDAQIDNLMRR